MTFTKFIERPVLSTVISILIVILGIIGLVSLPVEQYPDIAPPTVSVRTTYTGADAQAVENSVLAPLEESINGVEGMTYMTATAYNDGSASIQVYFEPTINGDMAAVNVQNRVQEAQSLLPSEVTQVGVTVRKRQTSQVMMISLTSEEGVYDDEFLTNYVDINITPALKRVSGVGDVNSPGAKTYSMRIWLDPEKMQQHGLIPSDISTVLAEQNIEAAPGSIGEQSDIAYEYTMRYTGRLKTAEEFGNIILTSDTEGNTLRVKDVARVELGGLEYNVTMRGNNRPSSMLVVQQIAGSNATQIASDCKEVMEELAKSFPAGVEYEINYDVTEFLFASIEEVVKTLILTLILVLIVVYIFLQDFRSTLIPIIAVPVSLIGTFFFLYIFGFSVNLLTLSAMLLAIAIVVDDAIVVVEAVHAKLDAGYQSSLTASIDAMNEISGAIISITLVMAAVFIPVSFIGGTSGTFYKEFGITMAISIVISAVNALTLSPCLCAVFLKPHNADGTEKKMSLVDRFHASFNTAYDKVLNKYKKGVTRLVKGPVIVAIAILIGIVALVVSMNTTRTGLVPDEDTGVVFCTISMPPATSMARTQQIVNTVDSMLANIECVDLREQLVGYNFIAGQGSDQATFIVKLKPFEERNSKETAQDVLNMIYAQTASIKDASILAFAPPMVQGFSASNAVSLVMQDKTGGELTKFFEVTQSFLAELNQRPEIQVAMTSYNPNYPQYMVNVDVAKCKQAGISPSTVLSTLQGYYGGLYASNFNSYGKIYRVMVQSEASERSTLDTFQKIYVRTDGGMAPVTAFCTLEKIYGPSSVNHFNLFTSIDVSVMPMDGYSTGNVLQAIAEVAETNLPQGYGYDYSGLTREENNESNTTGLIFVLCLIFVYLILSAQYESYILPLSVILSLPFGLAGAFIFTQLFEHSNDIYMQISLIMLIGLLAKNAILIVQFALERRQLGMAVTYSAILGAAARLRPILMTSLAMVIGLLPMMFATGVGKNGNQTLGAAAVGGMFIGMICQIFVVPALFVIFQKLQERFRPMKFKGLVSGEGDTELAQYKSPAQKNIRNIYRTFGGTLPMIALALVMFSSCGVYNKYERPDFDASALYRDTASTDGYLAADDTTTLGSTPWREVFTDPCLQELIDSALTRNTDLLTAALSVTQAKAQLSSARLAYFPTFQFAPTGTLSSWDMGKATQTYSLPIEASWNVDLFGSLTTAKRAQKAAYLQAQDYQRAVRTSLIANVANTYYTLLMLDRQLEITKVNEKLTKDTYDMMVAQKKYASTDESGVQSAYANYMSVLASIPELERQIRETENTMSLLLRDAPGTIERTTMEAQELPAEFSTGVSVQLLNRRPDVHAAEMTLANCFYNTANARSAFYPSITISGSAGWTNSSGSGIVNPGKLLASAVGSLVQPIFMNGKLVAQLKVAKAQQEAAYLAWEQSILNAGSEVSNALTLYQTSTEKVALETEQVAALQRNVEVAEKMFKASEGYNYLNVISAQQSLLSAQLTLISDQFYKMQAIVNLYYALGGGGEE